jgi:hypothetical protein
MSSAPLDFTNPQLETSQNKYLDITSKLNDYNEIHNLNEHLLTSNTLEIQRLNTINNQLKSQLMKAKQNYLLTDYAIHEYSVANNFLGFTIILVCVMLFFVAKATAAQKNMILIISSVIGVIYLFILILILNSNIKRRKYAWAQWYWAPNVVKK